MFPAGQKRTDSKIRDDQIVGILFHVKDVNDLRSLCIVTYPGVALTAGGCDRAWLNSQRSRFEASRIPPPAAMARVPYSVYGIYKERFFRGDAPTTLEGVLKLLKLTSGNLIRP